jgi:molybdate/tungstate transport system substrate-binding protein
VGLTRRQLLGLGVGTALGVGAVGRYSGSPAPEEPTTDGTTPDALVAGSLLSLASATPGASVEAHGSVTVRQFLQEGLRRPDVVALADPVLFAGIAEEVTLFATNALTLAYNPESPRAGAIRDDWATAIGREDARVGRTDPATDPLGYRTVLALELAVEAGLIDRVPPVVENTTTVPETQLMRVLEQGSLDAAFTYRSMAVEHDLPFIDLPAEIDFSDPSRAEAYASVSVELDAGTVRGRPIRYAATPLTARGRPWFDALVGRKDRLREHGFTVPSAYPETTVVE